jgi:hypothetical protein
VIGGVVLAHVGIEQQHRHASDRRLPDPQLNPASGQLDLDA